jgi:hypothetical protein
MSSQELKKFITLLESIEAETMPSVTEEAVDLAHLSDMLDQLEEHLNQAVGIANDLARYGRDVPGPFAGQIRSYLAPHLESWLDDRRQPGSIPNLRGMLINSGEEDEEYGDLEEDYAAKSPADSSSPLSHANQQDLVVKGNHNEDQ